MDFENKKFKSSWVMKQVDEISNVTNGFSFKSNDFDSSHPIKSIKITNVGVMEFVESNENNLPIKYSDSHSKLRVKTGDLVLALTRTIISTGLKVAKIPESYDGALLNQRVAAIAPNDSVDDNYLYYYFCSTNVYDYVLLNVNTLMQPNLSIKDLKRMQVPICALEEQKQIVAILDQAFAAIDQAQANIKQNIQYAKDLFQSKLNQIFSQQGEGWEEKSLGDVCGVLNGYAFKSKDVVNNSNTQLLRMGNLYQNKLNLQRKPVFYPDSYAQEFKDYLLDEGDLIMSLTGTVDKTDYGYTVMVEDIPVNLLLNQRIMKIEITDETILNRNYLKNYLLSPGFLKKLYATASGTRQANLSSKTILTLPINFPSDINLQNEIVDLLNELRSQTYLIIEKYKQKNDDLDELKKSLLQKAFSGELTQNIQAA